MNGLKVKNIKLGFILVGLVVLSACGSGGLASTDTSTNTDNITSAQIASAQAEIDGIGNTDTTSSVTNLTATQIETAQASLDAIEPPTSIF